MLKLLLDKDACSLSYIMYKYSVWGVYKHCLIIAILMKICLCITRFNIEIIHTKTKKKRWVHKICNIYFFAWPRIMKISQFENRLKLPQMVL